LQEPNLWKNNPCGLTKSNLHFTRDSNCRTAIYASPELGLTFHPDLSSRDCTTCSFVVDGNKIYISSVYLDCLLTVEEAAWMNTIQKADTAHQHLIAGINTNAHSDVWGSPATDRRGLAVENVLFQAGLCVLNKGSKPTFETAMAATLIDITVASPAIASMITNWQVMQEMHLSDHHMLSADLPVLPDVMPLRKGRNLKKADWKEFTQHIKTAFSGHTDPMLWTA
jgi:hypothetical protein